jgi:DNA-binding NarL/FixJ family response regulator
MPKVIKPEIIEQILKLNRLGKLKKEIMEQLGVSTKTITKILNNKKT